MDRYTPDTIEKVRSLLDRLPGDMKVEAEPGTVMEKTVAELRERSTWPGGLVIVIPRPLYPESAVKIERQTP